MVKFGGAGRKKQCCKLRKCAYIVGTPDLVTSSLSVPEVTSSTLDLRMSDSTGTSASGLIQKSTGRTTSSSDFLSQYSRTIHRVVGDGNCLFRSLSFQLFKTELHHFKLRNNLVWIISLNREQFSKFLFSTDGIQEHIKHMAKPNVWGTQVEIVAAASLFQIPVYYCSKNSNGDYIWGVFKPIPPQNIAFPRVVDPVFMDRQQIKHFELLYYTDTHYDAVMSAETGSVSESPPPLTGKCNDKPIDLTSTAN